jgi:hypothetical protein
VPKTVDQKGGEPPRPLGARCGNGPLDREKIVDGHVVAQHPLALARFEERGDGGADHRQTLVRRRRPLGEHRAYRLDHAALRPHVIDEAIEEARERDVGRMLREELRSLVAELLDLLSVRRFEERLTRRVVPVERRFS